MGKFTAALTHKDQSSQHQVYVVRGLNTNLLGLPAITSLSLAARLDTAAHTRNGSYDDQVRNKFPTVFNSLGTLGEEFTTNLKPNAVPQAIYTARHVPLPL